jgi:hypothetical protein
MGTVDEERAFSLAPNLWPVDKRIGEEENTARAYLHSGGAR